MSIRVYISLRKIVEDSDKANDFVDEIREHLQGHVTCSMSSRLSNHNPREQLTEEQESE